jgi:molybdate transport system ATP-binding protein
MKLSVSLQKRFSGFETSFDFTTHANRVGIFGSSGSGKSTLVHMLAGLVPPDSGVIELDGKVLFDSKSSISVPPEQRRIGVVFQQAHLFPHMSARRNLLYGYRRTPAPQRQIEPEALIKVLNLEELLERNVNTLSGGERQRVALGRAVLSSPRLLLMDEPLSSLDEGLKYQVIPYLTAVFEEFQLPVLLVSHSTNEIRLMTEEVIVVHKGRVSDQIDPETLARQRMGRRRAGYINLLELQDAKPQDGLISFCWESNRLLLSSGLGVEPGMFELSSKDIMLFKRHPEAISARNLLPCRVGEIFDMEGRLGVELHCDKGQLIAQVAQKAVEELDIVPDREIFAAIKSSAFRRLY